jgi:hypothetical protein
MNVYRGRRKYLTGASPVHDTQAEKGESRRVQMCARAVELVLAKLGRAELVRAGPAAHRECAARAGDADAASLAALLALQGHEPLPLLLEHIEQVRHSQ